MFRKSLVITVALGLVASPAASAQKKPVKPPKSGAAAVTLDAKQATVLFTTASTLSGRLTGPTTAGVTVRLEQDTVAPLGDRFAATALTTKTATNGTYSFSVKPSVNTSYRVVALATPNATSPARVVRVRPLVGLSVSDLTPRARSLVRFSGTVRPAHTGSLALIQRRTSTGAWATVSRVKLRAATLGRSVYAKSIRVSRTGVYRVKVAAHSDHVSGISRLRTLKVG